MGKTYKSAMGKTVDMEALAAKNETEISVGNTNSNAKGDLLGSGGKIRKRASEVVQAHYEKTPKPIQKEVSLKPSGVLDDEIFEPKSEASAKKAKPSKKVEKPLPDGSIQMVDGE